MPPSASTGASTAPSGRSGSKASATGPAATSLLPVGAVRGGEMPDGSSSTIGTGIIARISGVGGT